MQPWTIRRRGRKTSKAGKAERKRPGLSGKPSPAFHLYSMHEESMDEKKTPLAVSPSEAGQKLLGFLARRVSASEGELHRWIRTGQVRVNGARAKAFDRLGEGSLVRVPPFAVLKDPCGGPEHAPIQGLPVLYEDDSLLILGKPAGMTVQGGTGHADNMVRRVAEAFAGAPFIPAPLHRLDRDTSGIAAFGKTYRALRFYTDTLAGRGEGAHMRKDYLAWTEGRWEKRLHVLEDMLIRNAGSGLMEISRDKGQKALLKAFPLAERKIGGRGFTLVLARLFTGRMHQIRIQMASRGHPLAGDPWYGRGGTGLKLHAFRLILPRPDGLPPLKIELPPPWRDEWSLDKALTERAFFPGDGETDRDACDMTRQ